MDYIKKNKGTIITVTVATTVGVVSLPVLLAVGGFGAGGIAAGSTAANMMSGAMIANHGVLASGKNSFLLVKFFSMK